MNTTKSADSSYKNCAADKRCRSNVQPLFGGSYPFCAPDRSLYFPPPDERKGETKAESDRHLGKSIVAHWSRLCRDTAGTMAGLRQKNAAGVKING